MKKHKCQFCKREFIGGKERKFCSISCSTKRQYRDNPNYGLQKGHKLRNGLIPWNKGIPNPEWSKRQTENNISKRLDVREKMSKARLGVRPWNWNGGHSKNRRYARLQWKKLVKEIYERDNWTCFDCEKKGGILNAHHLKPWSRYPELAFDKNNIITLCLSCHAKRHLKKERGRFCETQEVMPL